VWYYDKEYDEGLDTTLIFVRRSSEPGHVNYLTWSVACRQFCSHRCRSGPQPDPNGRGSFFAQPSLLEQKGPVIESSER